MYNQVSIKTNAHIYISPIMGDVLPHNPLRVLVLGLLSEGLGSLSYNLRS